MSPSLSPPSIAAAACLFPSSSSPFGSSSSSPIGGDAMLRQSSSFFRCIQQQSKSHSLFLLDKSHEHHKRFLPSPSSLLSCRPWSAACDSGDPSPPSSSFSTSTTSSTSPPSPTSKISSKSPSSSSSPSCGSAAVAEALGSSSGSDGGGGGGIDFFWYRRFPRQMALTQFEANGPIEDRASLCLVNTSRAGVDEKEEEGGQVIMAAVCDGHGGFEVADYVQRMLPLYIQRYLMEVPLETSGPSSSSPSSYITSMFSNGASSSSSASSSSPSLVPCREGPRRTNSSAAAADEERRAALLLRVAAAEAREEGGESKLVLGNCLSFLSARDINESMGKAFRDLDEEIFRNLEGVYRMGYSKSVKTGACCVCVLADDTRIVVANVGDCKAVAYYCVWWWWLISGLLLCG
eukprot:GHVS01032309.1.p1 GENE.GHVS01032309.1~~GHVS01032309.1.p1  ORF type:complete len:405 (+),score=148.69 GHVS01032309.1:130-1344(+)